MSRASRSGLLVLALTVIVAGLAEARQYAWLGVRIRDISEVEMEELAARHGIREGFGVFVVDVIDATPAARAGIKRGDVVVALDRRPVVEGRVLQRLIAGSSLEVDVRLTVLRADGRHELVMRLAPMPREVAGERVAAEFGFVIRDSQGQGEPPSQGAGSATAAVVAVMRGSVAEKAGLIVGDVILQIGDRPIVTRDAAREALAEASSERPLRLIVRRDRETLAVTIPPP